MHPIYCLDFPPTLSLPELQSFFLLISLSSLLSVFSPPYFLILPLLFLFRTLHIAYTDGSVRGSQVSGRISLIAAKELSSSSNAERPSREEVSVTVLPIQIVKVAASATSPNIEAPPTQRRVKLRSMSQLPLLPPPGAPIAGWEKANLSQTSVHSGNTGPPLFCCFLSRVYVDVQGHVGTLSSQKPFPPG